MHPQKTLICVAFAMLTVKPVKLWSWCLPKQTKTLDRRHQCLDFYTSNFEFPIWFFEQTLWAKLNSTYSSNLSNNSTVLPKSPKTLGLAYQLTMGTEELFFCGFPKSIWEKICIFPPFFISFNHFFLPTCFWGYIILFMAPQLTQGNLLRKYLVPMWKNKIYEI